jgi:hypothetical protein
MNPTTLAQYADKIRFLAAGGSGQNATVTCALAASGRVRDYGLAAGGSGYSVNDVLTCDSATFEVTSVDAGVITGIAIATLGTTVTTGNGKATTVAPAGGTGATLNLVAEKGIASATITAGGTGYINATAQLSGGSGSGGSITLGVSNGVVSTRTVVSAGWYLTAPTVTVIAQPPVDANEWLSLLTTFDATLLNERLLEVIGTEKATVIIDPRGVSALETLRSSLLNS